MSVRFMGFKTYIRKSGRSNTFSFEKEVAVRRNRSTVLQRGLLGLSLVGVFPLCGCGGATSGGNATANTAEERRYQSLQKLGAMQSKAAIAEKKAEALAEIARKKAAGGGP